MVRRGRGTLRSIGLGARETAPQPTAPRILSRGTGWRCAIFFTFWPLYSRESSPLYPLHRRWASPVAGLESRRCG